MGVQDRPIDKPPYPVYELTDKKQKDVYGIAIGNSV